MSFLCRSACAASRVLVCRSTVSRISTIGLTTHHQRTFASSSEAILDQAATEQLVRRIINAESLRPFSESLGVKEAIALDVSELPTLSPEVCPEELLPYLAIPSRMSALPSFTLEGLRADSTKRKRAKKMNKHKWKKRLKAQRRRSRKDLAQ